jgi:hypothetical protein
MLSLDDPKWAKLTGGYRTPIDVRPLLLRLEADPSAAWDELWNELYHQGDVGTASFAAVPHLVRIHRSRGVVDWNTYAMIASIELARDDPRNPKLPAWAAVGYDTALGELAKLGLEELPRAELPEAVRAILSVIAIAYGARAHGRVVLEFDEDEVREIVEAYEAG